MDWHRLDKDKMMTMIASVKSAGEAMLFSPVTSEAKCARLPFYDNFLFYRLTNFSSMPVFSLDFLGDGERYFYVDGSEQAILSINEQFGLRLNEANIVQYLNFYFFNVRSEDGDILLVKNAEEGQTLDLYDDERRESIDIMPENVKITFVESKEAFVVNAPVYYLGGIMEANIIVTQHGSVTVQPLKMLITGGMQ